MEQAISNSQTGLGLWWSKLGKWQALAATVTLATFFVTLTLTGNKETAIGVALGAAVVVLPFDGHPSKKVILTSCLVEFLVIFVPMWLLG